MKKNVEKITIRYCAAINKINAWNLVKIIITRITYCTSHKFCICVLARTMLLNLSNVRLISNILAFSSWYFSFGNVNYTQQLIGTSTFYFPTKSHHWAAVELISHFSRIWNNSTDSAVPIHVLSTDVHSGLMSIIHSSLHTSVTSTWD